MLLRNVFKHPQSTLYSLDENPRAMPIETRGKSVALYVSLQTLGPRTAYEVHCGSEFSLPDFLLMYDWYLSMCLKFIVERNR
jgi:hypothetical protein